MDDPDFDPGTVTVGPTLLELTSFEASGNSGGVLIEWATASEIDTEGFNLWRSETEAGSYMKINASLIPSEAGPLGGASYEYTDVDVIPGTTYFYKLEAVDMYGQSEFFGPVSAVSASQGWGAASTLETGSSKISSAVNSLLMIMAAAVFVVACKGIRRRQK